MTSVLIGLNASKTARNMCYLSSDIAVPCNKKQIAFGGFPTFPDKIQLLEIQKATKCRKIDTGTANRGNV